MIVAASATFAVPSKDIAGAVTKLPVIEKSLAFCNLVAVDATPVKSPVMSPTKELAVIMPVGALTPEESIVVADQTVNEVVIATSPNTFNCSVGVVVVPIPTLANV